MPSIGCLILRAAARVSSSVALAAYRLKAVAAAAAARSGSGGAAASDPLKHSSFVTAAGTARSPASSGSFHPHVAAEPSRSRLSHDSGSTIAKLNAVFDGSPFVQPDWAKFEADEKDLESDDALWNLCERWCKFFNQERDREEMTRRFSYFKETVLRVEENKKSDLPYRLGINKFADGKLRELCRKSSTRNYVKRRRRSSASPIYGSEVGFLFNDEDPAANKEAWPAAATETPDPSAIE